jgi:plastocyanin
MRTARRSLSLTLLAVLSSAPAWAAGGTLKGKVDATPAKYLEDTVVYLKEVPGAFAPKTASIDQKGMKFIPHILLVTVGDSVKFLNNDTVVHNVYSPDNEGYNLGSFKAGENAAHVFTKQGVYSQLCSIHPEMLAYVFVGQNPYAAVVDKSGQYEIKDVPPGTYKLAVWNPKLKAADKSVTVAAGETTENFSIKR